MRVILGFEFDSRAVAIDGADIYDGPDPTHDSGETQTESGEAKLHYGLALVSRIKIVRAKETEKRAENDKRAAILCVRVRLKIEIERGRGGRGG